MQTRRDQLQAYRFQNRRALAALVTGQPNVLEPPMRRLTVTTLSGIMIAILIALVFGVIALIHPSAGNSWKTAGAVIVDQDNNSTYVYTDDQLHPVLNYTSAVLAVSGTNRVQRVQVSSSDIAGARYSYEIGIPGIPSALPPHASLTGYPLSVCSVQHKTTRGGAAAVTLHVGSAGGRTEVPAAQGVLVAAPGSHQQSYLLYGGRRLAVGSDQIAATLGYDAPPVIVGTSFLDSVPIGPALAPPQIAGARSSLTDYAIAGRPRLIGTLVQVSGSHSVYIALPGGTRQLTPLEQALFVGYPPLQASLADATAHVDETTNDPLAGLRTLPTSPPAVDATAAARAGVCAVYTSGTAAPRLTLTAAALPSFLVGTITESTTSRGGRADTVDVPATEGMLATPADAPGTVLVISDQGVKYAFARTGLLSGFGYSRADAKKVPPQLLTLIPSGTGLSTAAALARVAP